MAGTPRAIEGSKNIKNEPRVCVCSLLFIKSSKLLVHTADQGYNGITMFEVSGKEPHFVCQLVRHTKSRIIGMRVSLPQDTQI